MIIPKLEIGTYVKVDCATITNVKGSIRTGEIVECNEDGSYDVQIAEMLIPFCDQVNLVNFNLAIEEIIPGMNIKFFNGVAGKIIRKTPEASLCFDIKTHKFEHCIHYDFFESVYNKFEKNEQVWYKERHGKVINQLDDLWYEVEINGSLLKIAEFELIKATVKATEQNKKSLFKWLKNLI